MIRSIGYTDRRSLIRKQKILKNQHILLEHTAEYMAKIDK